MIAVAIDGPAGAGKSTMARAVAKSLGYVYVDTGALYRAIGYAVTQKGVDPTDAAGIAPLLPGIRVELKFIDGEQRVLVNGSDVSSLIRTPEMSMAASAVSAHKEVRDCLFSLQQDIARTNNVVMDGRDIGTVVLPHAQVKIFLTATPKDRAQRRYEELLQKGERVTYEEVLHDVRQRDDNDTNRALSPLKPASDAIMLDTTGNTVERSVAVITQLVKERLS